MNRTNATIRSANPLATVPPFDIQEPRHSWSAELLLPEQFFVSARESAAVWTGERRLLYAVLQDAVHAFLKYRDSHSVRGQRLFRETQAWFWSENCDWLYAFGSICLYLQLDPDHIRRGLQRWLRPVGSLPHSVRLGRSEKARSAHHGALTRAA